MVDTTTTPDLEGDHRVTDLSRGKRYEELAVGDKFTGMSFTITESMITLACALFNDTAPLHRDRELAAAAGFANPIAPGVLTMGLCIAPIAMIAGASSLTHLTDAVTYKAPVYAGDTLRVVLEITRKEKKSRFGLVEYTTTVTNQDGRHVASVVTLMGHKYLAD